MTGHTYITRELDSGAEAEIRVEWSAATASPGDGSTQVWIEGATIQGEPVTLTEAETEEAKIDAYDECEGRGGYEPDYEPFY
jgi:hypothetical protein